RARAVRRPCRRAARLLEARDAPLPRARGDPDRAPGLSLVEVCERRAELLALGGQGRERLRQAPLALRGEAEVGDAAVGGRGLTRDEADLLRPAHELRHRALRELEA